VLRCVETDAQKVRLASLDKFDAVNELAFHDSHVGDNPRWRLDTAAIADGDNGANDQLTI